MAEAAVRITVEMTEAREARLREALEGMRDLLDAARIERLMKAVRADSFGDPVIAETLDEAMLSGAGALVAELSSALDAALAEPTG